MDATEGLLADGTIVAIRAIDPSDADRLVRFHGRLSPETTRLRFFNVHPTLLDREVERFTNVDHGNREALVAQLDDDIIGVARYDRAVTPDGKPAGEAEAAFVVEDRWQGTGVGTLLLDRLASVARDRGIARFTAVTLPENRRMLRVFRSTGLPTTSHFGDGTVEVSIELSPTGDAVAAGQGREHVAESRSIGRLLRPAGIAVIGASDKPSSVGGAVVRNLVNGQFAGTLSVVHRTASSVGGVTAYPAVADVPGQLDIAVVAVPADQVERVAQECGVRGVHGLVVVSAGFAESGPEGAERQRRVVQTAHRHGMRLIGPNCLGIVNTDPAVRMNATFAASRVPAGRVGLLSQSGAVGIALLDAADRGGLGISTFVSAGNKADVSGNDLLQYWLDDPGTDVVLLYLESFGNPRKFSRLARRLGQAKPVVAVKSGRTAVGQRAASSHTAAMASSDVAVDALFRECGVIRVDTVAQLLETGLVLANQPLPAGERLAVVGNSGGPGIMAADAATTAGLTLPELSPETQQALAALLPAGAATANPVDLLAAAGPGQYADAVRAVAADPSIDALVVIHTPTLVADPDEVMASVADAAATGAAKPVVAVRVGAVASGLLRPAGGARAMPVFPAVEEAVFAMGRSATYAEWRRRAAVAAAVPEDLAGADVVAAREVARRAAGRWLEPAEVGEMLAAMGIPSIPTVTVADESAAVSAADRVGYPVALKAVGPVHKTESGGVALDLSDAAAVSAAWRAMRARLGAEMTRGIVQPMARPGVETIAGVVQDRLFGPLLLFGLGGTSAELLQDRAVRLVPLTRPDATALVTSLRGSPLLTGYRGSTPVDRTALEDLLLRLSLLAEAVPEIAEIDCNPVVARPEGVEVLDARVRVAPPPPP